MFLRNLVTVLMLFSVNCFASEFKYILPESLGSKVITSYEKMEPIMGTYVYLPTINYSTILAEALSLPNVDNKLVAKEILNNGVCYSGGDKEFQSSKTDLEEVKNNQNKINKMVLEGIHKNLLPFLTCYQLRVAALARPGSLLANVGDRLDIILAAFAQADKDSNE